MATSQLVKHCPRCRGTRPFRCTGRFRVNASGRLLDVWLLFECAGCGDTARLPVLERVPVSRVPRARLDAFTANDAALALAVASDRTLLRRGGFRAVRSSRSSPGRSC